MTQSKQGFSQALQSIRARLVQAPSLDAQAVSPATMSAAIARLAPRAVVEDRHARESRFAPLDGEGDVRVGDRWLTDKSGLPVFVPRWTSHQTCNTEIDRPSLPPAITDFGFALVVLGDCDRHTRLAEGGADAKAS